VPGEQQSRGHGGGVVDRCHVENPGRFGLDRRLVRKHPLGDYGDVDAVVVECPREGLHETGQVGAVRVHRIHRHPLRAQPVHDAVTARAGPADQDGGVLGLHQARHDRRPDVGRASDEQHGRHGGTVPAHR
jgi:hypothetical protein